MLWVGGQIVVHGIEHFGFKTLPDFIHHMAEGAAHAVPFAGAVIEWVVGAIGYGIFGVIFGGIIVAVHHKVVHR